MRNKAYAMFAVVIVAVMMLPCVAHAVDGVILIDQANAVAGNVTPLDAPGFPVTINRPGSYRLSSNLDVQSGVSGIAIVVSDVTIDLNGFTVRAIGGQGISGIHIAPAGTAVRNLRGIAIRNGTVLNFIVGIDLTSSTQSVIENINAHDNTDSGIAAGRNSIVRGNTAVRNGNQGIGAGRNSTVSGNTASENGTFGITVGDNAADDGDTPSNSTVSGNTASQNNIGIRVGRNSTVSGNTASQNGNIGIEVFCPGSVVGNTAAENGFGSIVLFQSIVFLGSCTTANNSE
jgi:parallel beta-helix repeat protein